MNTQERIARVTDKIQRIIAAGLPHKEFALSPEEFRDLTASEFAELAKELPDLKVDDHGAYYYGHLYINEVFVNATSAYGTRVRREDNLRAELEELIAPKQVAA